MRSSAIGWSTCGVRDVRRLATLIIPSSERNRVFLDLPGVWSWLQASRFLEEPLQGPL